MVKNELYAHANSGVNSSITKHKSARSLPTAHRRQASNTQAAVLIGSGSTNIDNNAPAVFNNNHKQKNSNHKRKKSNVAVARSRNASPANDQLNLLSAALAQNVSLPKTTNTTNTTNTTSNVVNVCKIFVGGLSWETTQTSLHQYFVKFGEIAECVLMLDPHSQRSRGFGFVTFVNSDSVSNVLSSGPHVLDKKVIDPKAAIPRTNKDIINIGNNSPINSNPNNFNSMAVNSFGSNNNNSEMNFDEFESIPKFNIAENSDFYEQINNNGEFVGMMNMEDYHHMYHEISSNHIEVEPNSCLKIFVGGIGNISENVVREYFEKFGKLTDVTIMYDKVTGKHRGFGFVGFESTETVDQVCKSRFHAINKKTIEVKRAVPKDANMSALMSKKCSLSPQHNLNSNMNIRGEAKQHSNNVSHSFNANMLNMGSYESPLQFFSFNPYTRMQPSSMPHDLCFEYYSSFLNYINETNKISPHIDLLNKSAERDSLDCLNDINAFNIATASLRSQEKKSVNEKKHDNNKDEEEDNISNEWEFQDAMLNNSLYVSEEEYENFEKKFDVMQKLSFRKSSDLVEEKGVVKNKNLFDNTVENEIHQKSEVENARRNSCSAIRREVDNEMVVDPQEYNKENTDNYQNRKLVSEPRYNLSTSTDSSLRRTL